MPRSPRNSKFFDYPFVKSHGENNAIPVAEIAWVKPCFAFPGLDLIRTAASHLELR